MKSKSQALTNQLKVYRADKGLSQTQLAGLVGVKRQAIYDIESGKYAPNTLIALRLAKHLSCRVEDLFNEEIDDVTSFTLVGPSLAHAARVSLARVRGSLIAYPLPGSDPFNTNFEAADGLISPGQDSIKLLCPPDAPDKTLILLGCDPAFALLSAYVSRRAPDMRITYRFASSLKAVNGLASGHAHLAGTHLHSGTSAHGDNILLAQKSLGQKSATIIGFSQIEEGLIVAPGNPYSIRSLEDLTNPRVRLINRESGAALRILLDDLLEKQGIPSEKIVGYDDVVRSHMEGVMRVFYRKADAALGFRAVANMYGLDFVPLISANCELVLPQDLLEHPAMKILLDTLQTRALRDELKALAGYDVESTGSIIAKI
jgi:putative molybdopterin biosynthesis protein